MMTSKLRIRTTQVTLFRKSKQSRRPILCSKPPSSSSARAPEPVFRLAVLAARAAAAGPAYAPFATMFVDGLEDQMGPNAPAYLVLRGLATSFLGVLAILALFAIGSFL